MRKGKTGSPISSSAHLRAVLHYDKYRPQPLVNDEQSMPDQLLPTKASGVTLTPEAALENTLGYDQYRPEVNEMGGHYFPNRPIKNYGLGASELEIIDNCKQWSNPHVFAFHLITSIHPQLVVILQKHGVDAEKFTETYTVAFVHNFLESVGCDAKIEMAMVIHLIETASGLPHLHAHVTLPGTGYDDIAHTRIPVPKITPEMLAEGQAIADRTAEREMDRVLTRAWRLEVPELAGTFYDPINLPIPEPSSELDAWFPRPKIPAIALSPRPELPTLGGTLFPEGIWEAPTRFGEPSELAELVDELFADVTFEPTFNAPPRIPLFGPASASIEADEREATTPPSRSDMLAKTLKLAEIPLEVESPASVVNAAQNSSVIMPESNAAFIVVDESYPPHASDEGESFESMVEQLWPRRVRPNLTNSENESAEIVALVDTLFPATFWESADRFGDEDIARQIAELFSETDLDTHTAAHTDGVHLDWDERAMLPFRAVSRESAVEPPPSAVESDAVYPWRYTLSKSEDVAYRILPNWDAETSEGRLDLEVSWYVPTAKGWSTVRQNIFHNTPLDYLRLDEGLADSAAARQEAEMRFQEKVSQYQAPPEDDFNEVMYLGFEDWTHTTALDEKAKADGFLPYFPVDRLPFDPAEEAAFVDPLPEGVTWLGPAPIEDDALQWGIITRPDWEGSLRVYAIKQWTDEHEISRFTSSEIGLAAETIEDQIISITSVQQASVKELGPTLFALQKMSEKLGHPSIDFLAEGPPCSFSTLSQPDQSLPSESELFDEDDIEELNHEDNDENELDDDEQFLELDDEWDT